MTSWPCIVCSYHSLFHLFLVWICTALCYLHSTLTVLLSLLLYDTCPYPTDLRLSCTKTNTPLLLISYLCCRLLYRANLDSILYTTFYIQKPLMFWNRPVRWIKLIASRGNLQEISINGDDFKKKKEKKERW